MILKVWSSIMLQKAKDSEVEKGSKIYIVVSEGRYGNDEKLCWLQYRWCWTAKLKSPSISCNFKPEWSVKNLKYQSQTRGLMANEKFNPNIINTVKLTYRPLINIVFLMLF